MAPNPATDAELLDLLRKGDHAAFNQLYERHWKFLYNAGYNILRHHQDTLDLCQSILVWFWENREKLTIKSSIRSYLFTAMKYKAANLIRDGKLQAKLLDVFDMDDIRADEYIAVEVAELRTLIAQLVNDLPPRCREIFVMSREQQLTHREIAEQLDISEKTVDEQIHRALQKLRVPLGKLASFLFFL